MAATVAPRLRVDNGLQVRPGYPGSAAPADHPWLAARGIAVVAAPAQRGRAWVPPRCCHLTPPPCLAATPLPLLSQVFKYDGTLVAREKRDVLYEAAWVPAPAGTFEDRPQSPRAGGAAAAANGSSSGAAAALPAQPVRAAGYVPPHMRGKPGAAAAAAATFSLARDASDKGGKIPTGAVAARPAPASNLPPGAAPPPSKAASKNAKRRAAKKKAEGGEA